jgi:hypothetical protein
MQAEDAPDDDVPGGHGMQALELTDEKVPAAQGRHSLPVPICQS